MLLTTLGNYDIINLPYVNGAVAQLARASGSYPAGREFESPRRYQIDNKLELLWFEF